MMSAERFRAASEAAESWLNTVVSVAGMGKIGKPGSVDSAYRLLAPGPDEPWPNLLDSYNLHVDVLNGLRMRFAAVSDGPVELEAGRGYRAIAAMPERLYAERWSSAHEAAAGLVRLALDLLVSPLEGIDDAGEQEAAATEVLTHRWPALAVSMEWAATMQERIRRERAKVLDRMRPADAETTTIPSETALGVDDDRSLDERAVALFVSRPGMTKKEMAKRLPCHVKSLAPKRCPKLDAAIRAYRACDLPRGAKGVDGGMEAWDG